MIVFALPGVLTSCLLAWVLIRLLGQQNEERQAHRTEVARLVADAAAQLDRRAVSHREEIAALHQARIEEVSNLLQRIQAPEHAVAQHAGHNAGPDVPPLDLEDDLAMIEERERALEQFARELEGNT